VRITFLLTQSLESPSGLGRYWPLARELVRLGNQVTMLAFHHDYARASEHRFVCDGVQVVYVGQMHVSKRGNLKTYYGPARLLWITALGTLRMTWAAIRTPNDAIQLCKPHPMNGIAALIASMLKRCPVYLDCDDHEAASNRFDGRWQRWVVASFEDWLPRIACRITVNTRATERRLIQLGVPAERIIYVPNGVARSRSVRPHGEAVDALRQRFDLQGRKVVLYVVSMSLSSHPVDLLLEAFAGVRAREPSAVLVLVGGGEDYAVLQRQSERLGLVDCVRFVGRVPPARVPLYYGLADVTVDPVQDDAAARARSPLKVVESLAAGVPVVTGDVGDRQAMLALGGGLLVAPGDPRALAEGLLAVLGDHALQARLAAQANQAKEQHYWDVLVSDFWRAYG